MGVAGRLWILIGYDYELARYFSEKDVSIYYELSRTFETKVRKSGDPGGVSLLAGFGAGSLGNAPRDQILLFLVLHAACGGARGEKKSCGDTPRPSKGRLPEAIPLLRRMEKYRTPVRKIRDHSSLNLKVR